VEIKMETKQMGMEMIPIPTGMSFHSHRNVIPVDNSNHICKLFMNDCKIELTNKDRNRIGPLYIGAY